jgi:MFS family permease
MKIDLVGEKNRGFAMGLNEFSGYFAVGIVSYLSAYLANRYGLIPYPFYLGIVIASLGFLLSWVWVKDTRAYLQETSETSQIVPLKQVFWDTTWHHKTLSSITQAGLINNLNDGMIWGLLPILLLAANFNPSEIGIIAAIYPSVWGLGQLFTGKMSDVYSKKKCYFGECFYKASSFCVCP